ncbi:PREDICTED: tyrosine-protein phosphatase non-receptor type 2 isoform X2 [Ceratosolen solmsi marchali]|uniref:protein-tyrosine-phosphatase n=1 Tax=Ceratosolen solmsi marchali TaxID=326594 RepID=A0AAJ6YCP2_9HYME|nr:PREDICTED: tyrosine-protein phosphatase non-receptor type 2 isoform X2 [Ceratosolen solmsi marchali]
MTSSETPTTSNVETEYLEINSKNAWPMLYQYTRNECSHFEYTYDESTKPQNRSLNRYRDVWPYDHTRIVLKKGPCDYINANIVRMERAQRQYILTQGPLPNTISHFWLMVWEQNSKAIIMLNKVIEKNQVKCHQYWPLDGSSDHTMNLTDVDLKVEYISKTESSDYTICTLRLTDTESQKSRDILHFHYTTWPDFGVPRSPAAFLRFLADVRQSGALDQNVGPPIVHCSAGIGRSGTFCLVDTCLVLIEENGLNSVNVREVLIEMRQSRMGLIQTPDQLRFSYAAIIVGSKQLPLNNVNVDNSEIGNAQNDIYSFNYTTPEVTEVVEQPPLPPPRGESLTRSMMSDSTPGPITDNENSGNKPPDKPLPCEPSAGIDSNSTGSSNHVGEQNASSGDASTKRSKSDGDNSFQTNSPPSSPDSKNELRRRRMEKKDRIDAQVREMKRRQKQSEDWQKLKRSKNESSEQSEKTQQETESPS